MANDDPAWLENLLESGLRSDQPDMRDARCPKCKAADFVSISDLYAEGDAQYAPPTRRSAVTTTLVVAVILGGLAFYVYRRFGSNLGQIAAVAAGVITAATFLTRARANSDKYYHDRQRWSRTYLCRNCGQRVAG